jgi:hypothetical protein
METKKWYESKTVWASVLILAVSVLRLLGKPDVAGEIEAGSAGIAEWIVNAVTIALAGVALWGRLTAKKTIGE